MGEDEMEGDCAGSGPGSSESVKSQIIRIRFIAMAEIMFGIIVLLSQTTAIGYSYEFATHSLTGIWTSWFFLMSAGFSLFWSTRCTFNGLLVALLLQVISGAMSIPLFVSSSLVFGIYPFQWSSGLNGKGAALVSSSKAILTSNLIMIICSIVQLTLNVYNVWNCYTLAYGENKRNIYKYDDNGATANTNEAELNTRDGYDEGDEWSSSKNDNTVPSAAPLTPAEIKVIKICGFVGVFFALLIFCCQTSMFTMASEIGINIGIGIWGALYYCVTGAITAYHSSKPAAQSAVVIFTIQALQFVLSVPLVGISYYILAVFGSCLQDVRVPECPPGETSAGVTVAWLSVTVALSGTIQALTSLTLMLVCSQRVFASTTCMISGASVYPTG